MVRAAQKTRAARGVVAVGYALGRCGAAPPSARIGIGLIGAGNLNARRRDFLDCIRTRAAPVPCAEIGHLATTTCKIVEIGAQLGRPLGWDVARERFVGDAAADRFLSQTTRTPWIPPFA